MFLKLPHLSDTLPSTPLRQQWGWLSEAETTVAFVSCLFFSTPALVLLDSSSCSSRLQLLFSSTPALVLLDSSSYASPYPLPILSLSSPYPLPILSLSSPYPLPILSLSSPYPLPILSLSSPYPLPILSLSSCIVLKVVYTQKLKSIHFYTTFIFVLSYESGVGLC